VGEIDRGSVVLVRKDHRFSFLLVSVLAMILITPLLESVNQGGLTLAATFMFTLISLVFTATEIFW
jgi:hypothetical protein